MAKVKMKLIILFIRSCILSNLRKFGNSIKLGACGVGVPLPVGVGVPEPVGVGVELVQLASATHRLVPVVQLPPVQPAGKQFCCLGVVPEQLPTLQEPFCQAQGVPVEVGVGPLQVEQSALYPQPTAEKQLPPKHTI